MKNNNQVLDTKVPQGQVNETIAGLAYEHDKSKNKLYRRAASILFLSSLGFVLTGAGLAIKDIVFYDAELPSYGVIAFFALASSIGLYKGVKLANMATISKYEADNLRESAGIKKLNVKRKR